MQYDQRPNRPFPARGYGSRLSLSPNLPARPHERGALGWWYRLTTRPLTQTSATFDERERARRARLLSLIALGYLLLMLIGIPIGLTDPATLNAVLAGIALVVVVLVMNRQGWVTAAGILFVIASEAQFAYTIISAGQLDVIYIPLFSLMAVGLLIAVSVLPPEFVFVIALANTIFVIADVNLQPATPAVQAILDSSDNYTLVAQPIALYLIISIVSYLWVRGTVAEARRADRAEEIAALEHTLADQKRQLDIGIQQILQTHVRAANGDYTARAPLAQDNLLWQIASSLNNLLSRLQRSGQDTFQLHRTQEEAQRLAAAIDDAQAGRKPVWPAPSGTVIDLILERIRGGRRGGGIPAAMSEQRSGPGASQPMSGFPGGPPSGWPDPAPQPPQQGLPPAPPAYDDAFTGQASGDPFGTQQANPWTFPQDGPTP